MSERGFAAAVTFGHVPSLLELSASPLTGPALPRLRVAGAMAEGSHARPEPGLQAQFGFGATHYQCQKGPNSTPIRPSLLESTTCGWASSGPNLAPIRPKPEVVSSQGVGLGHQTAVQGVYPAKDSGLVARRNERELARCPASLSSLGGGWRGAQIQEKSARGVRLAPPVQALPIANPCRSARSSGATRRRRSAAHRPS